MRHSPSLGIYRSNFDKKRPTPLGVLVKYKRIYKVYILGEGGVIRKVGCCLILKKLLTPLFGLKTLESTRDR